MKDEPVHEPADAGGRTQDDLESSSQNQKRHERANQSRRAMVVALVLTSAFIAVEVVGGILANSLALLADAGHMLADAAALGLSVFAMWVASHRHTGQRTFGFHRAEILAALANGSALLIISAFIVWHAAVRLTTSPEIASGPMLAVAAAGLVVNLLAMRVLGRHQEHSLNVRGAFLHVASDALSSLGVIVAAIVVALTGWTAADALASLAIAVLIVIAGGRLVRDAASVLLEITPRHLNAHQVRSDLERLPGVEEVHDLHIWTVTSGFVSLSCHAQIASDSEADEVLRRATAMLRHRYDISHVTIQPETSAIHEEGEHCCLDEHRPASPARR